MEQSIQVLFTVIIFRTLTHSDCENSTDQMDRKLRVLVSGTGFAGQGHTEAFRAVGAEVVGIVGRTPSVVTEVASKLAIPYSCLLYTSPSPRDRG